MPPILILIRHAQALHNVTQDSSLHDPELSQSGREQCIKLRENLQNSMPAELRDNVGLIIVSPMRRTIETALLSLNVFLNKGVPIQADARWQENSDQPCDTGSALPVLAQEFPQIDYARLDAIYPDKTSNSAAAYRYNKQAIVARAQMALEDLYIRPEHVIIIVSHSGFLRQGVTGCWFDNADYRVFDFEEKADHKHYLLKQWDYTKTGGRNLSWEGLIEIGDDLPETTFLQ
ncbi:histidine phosphatase superfamily [Hyaloscypha finlandica]|nr:histidine phosphatase superfamily [Hyaloscypha finlandica]